jgi:hypothetical protein
MAELASELHGAAMSGSVLPLAGRCGLDLGPSGPDLGLAGCGCHGFALWFS